MTIILLALSLCCGGSQTASALLVEHGRYHPSRLRASRPPLHQIHQQCHPITTTLHRHAASPLLFATSNTDSSEISTRAMALQMLEENAMPPVNVDDNDNLQESPNDERLSNYDEDDRTPIELEFLNFMNTFLAYSEQDIQSLTTTSSRYLHYQHVDSQSKKRAHRRTKEEGIRYRALYSGVQAASLEPAVLRSFVVLFEDILPIRIAGRKIYAHLSNVMEEVREERRGEIARALEVCPIWGQNDIEYARGVWDTIMDEGLLLEHSLDSVAEDEQSQEGGIISLPQLIQLGVDQVLIQEGLVNDVTELELIVRNNVIQEDVESEKYLNKKKGRGAQVVQEDGKYLELTFAVFMKVLHQCTVQKQLQAENRIVEILQKLEQRARDQRMGGRNDNQDTSTLLAAKAIHSGSTTAFKKRQKYSDRYDGYVATFKIWELKYMGDDADAEMERRHPRRWDILRGCFCGGRNAKVVAALKIVYMDYSTLRFGGDLIFQLTKKIAS